MVKSDPTIYTAQSERRLYKVEYLVGSGQAHNVFRGGLYPANNSREQDLPLALRPRPSV